MDGKALSQRFPSLDN